MKKSVSPFTALTCQEKHLKWLEYQSAHLPYVQVEERPAPPADEPAKKQDLPAESFQTEPETKPEKPAPRFSQAPAAPPPPYPADYLRPRHRQYDAVIARMKQAEMRTRNYTPVE